MQGFKNLTCLTELALSYNNISTLPAELRERERGWEIQGGGITTTTAGHHNHRRPFFRRAPNSTKSTSFFFSRADLHSYGFISSFQSDLIGGIVIVGLLDLFLESYCLSLRTTLCVRFKMRLWLVVSCTLLLVGLKFLSLRTHHGGRPLMQRNIK